MSENSLRFPESAIAGGRMGTATVRAPWPSTQDAQHSAERAFDSVSIGQHPVSAAARKKPSKYRNSKCEHNGIRFDSEKERSRWFHLIQLQAGGAISDLRLQVAFVLTERKRRDDGNWERASKYVADFVYIDAATAKQVVEDVKSEATQKNRTYIQKRKQMLAVHDITIKEI
jgi:hypothetical protein